MNFPHALTGIYDEEVTAVYRSSDHEALVRFGHHALVIRGWDWSTEMADAVPAHVQTGLAELFSGDTIRHGTVTVGTLLGWASRRTKKISVMGFVASDGEPFTIERRRFLDSQQCLGDTFNRRLIREVIQTFVEMRLARDVTLLVRLVPCNGGTSLVISHGTDACVVMCVRGEDAGSDPMPFKVPS